MYIKEASILLKKYFPNWQVQYILKTILSPDKYFSPDYRLDQGEIKTIFNIIEKRKRDPYKPLFYLLNKVNFMGFDFDIEEGVFIPRPETEILVEEACRIYERYYSNKSNNKNKDEYDEYIEILDIGCGSGVIGLSLAKLIDKTKRLILSDISTKALICAMNNAKKLGLFTKTWFVVCDILSAFRVKKIDILVANLPYIGKSEIKKLPKEVRDYEPKEALYGGIDGSEKIKELLYEVISKKCAKFVLCEIGYSQRRELEEFLFSQGTSSYYFVEDLGGWDRVLVLTL